MTIRGKEALKVLKKYILSFVAIFALFLPTSAESIDEYKCDLMLKGYEFTNDGLSEAIIKKDKEAVELFVKADLNINLPDTEGYSALDRAIKVQDNEVTILIAKAGGETKKLTQADAKNSEEENVAPDNNSKPSVEIPEINKNKKDNKTKDIEKNSLKKFCELVSKNNFSEVEKIAQTTEEINLLSEEGLAPIHYAIFNNNAEMVKLLLKHGADVNITADDGLTPLDITVLNNQTEIAKILFEQGAELSENVADELEKFGCPMKYDEILNLYQADFDNIFETMNKIQQKIDNEKN